MANYESEQSLYHQQQQFIEEEITKNVEKQPLIGQQESVNSLETQLTGNEAFLRKLPHVGSLYRAIRRIRGDGNCFFRGFIFSYFEQLVLLRLNSEESFSTEFTRFRNLMAQSLDYMLEVGYSKVSVETFYDMVMELLSDEEFPSDLNTLESMFSETGESNYIVWYTRVVCAAYLKHYTDRFLPFVLSDTCAGVEDFCAREVEPMDKECEQVQVIAVAEYFGVPITIEYLDASDSADTNTHQFSPVSEGQDILTADISQNVRVHLLYRPSHYDVLYPVETPST